MPDNTPTLNQVARLYRPGRRIEWKVLKTLMEELAVIKELDIKQKRQLNAQQGNIARELEFLACTANQADRKQLCTMLRGIAAFKRHGLALEETLTKSVIGALIKEFEQRVHECDPEEVAALFEALDESQITIRETSIVTKTIARVEQLAKSAKDQLALQRLFAVLTPVYRRSNIPLPQRS